MRKIAVIGSMALLAFCAISRCGDGGAPGGDAGDDTCGDASAADCGGAGQDAKQDDAGHSDNDAGVDIGPAYDAAADTGDDSAVDGGVDVQDTGVDAGLDIGGDTASSDAGGPGPYDQDGVEPFHTLSADLTNDGHTFTEHIYVPDSAQPHAVVVLRSATQQTAGAYVTYCNRLASHGFLVLSRDDPGPLVNTKVVVADIEYMVLQWLPAQNADAGSDLYGRADLTRVGLAGHSRGGKATLLAAEGGLKGNVKAWFGIDMIDVTFVDDGVYAVTEVGTVGIPTTFLVATVPSNCSPAANNGQALFATAPSPSVLLLAMGAGHTQFEDPGACLLCSVCTPAGTADQAVVEAYARRYVTAFFARELLGDASVGPAFEGAGVAQDVAAGLIQVQTK